MTKNEIIKLYIGDLKSKVTETDARNNRIEMLEDELETTKPVNVDLADIGASLKDLHDNHAYFQGDNWEALKRVIPDLDNISVSLYEAMNLIDDYLNAGFKENRAKAHDKGKELYEKYYGKKYLNRNER
jgi:hypothetical protein